MLRAILTNRLSTNNEAKENRTLHKTPSKKGLNKTIGANKSLKNQSSAKKLSKFQNYNSDFNALNIINDDKELLKQNNLKKPLKISHQRAPLSNIKKANIKEKSFINLNNQLKNSRTLKRKSSTPLSLTPSSSSTLKGLNNNNNKFHNENVFDNENTPIQYHHNGHNNNALKRQNSISHLSSTLTLPDSLNHNTLKKSHSFENDIFNQNSIKEDNIFISYMKNNINSLVDDDIEYMPPSLTHLEEEIEPKYKINYEDLLKLNTSNTTVVDSDLFERVNGDIDIGINSETDALKAKKFEFVNDFILNLDSSKSKIKNKKEEQGKEKIKDKGKEKIKSNKNNNKDDKDNNNNKDNKTLKIKTKDEKEKEESIIKKKMKEKALQKKLSQDFNLSFEEASEDEEIKLPDFLITEDKDSLYFDEIHL